MTETNPWWRRAWEMIVPPVTDFQTLLVGQAETLEQACTALSAYLQNGNAALAPPVRDQVARGHAQRDDTLAQLHRTFITPIDREDIYTLTMAIDHVLDYLKNTVREVEVLQVEPDEWMQQMAEQLGLGAGQLRQGLELLRDGQVANIPETVGTRHVERHVEKYYRKALAEMFEGEEHQRLLDKGEQLSGRECMDFLTVRIKRREVYRHLSNAADRLAHAGEALRDISIKYE